MHYPVGVFMFNPIQSKANRNNRTEKPKTEPNQKQKRKKNRNFKWIVLVFASLGINQSNPIQTEIFILVYILLYEFL